jgi:hypothetical protein
MAHPQIADGGDGLVIWRVAAIVLNKQSRIADKGWSSIFCSGLVAKKSSPQEIDHEVLYERKLMKRIFGWKRDEMKGRWRNLHNEELHNFNFSVTIIRMTKSRRMR